MNFRPSQILLCASLFVSGCAARAYYKAAEATKSRSPQGAMEYVQLCLSEDSEHEEALALKKNLIAQVQNQITSRAQNHEQSQRYDRQVRDYDRLMAFYQSAGQSAQDVLQKREQACGMAAQLYEQKVLGLIQGGQEQEPRPLSSLSKKEAQSAAKDARIGVAFGGTQELRTLYTKLKSLGIERIVITDFVNLDRRFANFGLNLSATTHTKLAARNPEFLEFLNREQTVTKQLMDEKELNILINKQDDEDALLKNMKGADYYVLGKVLSMIPTDTGWKQTRYRKSARVAIYATVNKKRKKVGEKTVWCNWTVSRRETSLSVKASYKVAAVASTQIVKRDSLLHKAADSYAYVSEKSGDDRAFRGPGTNLPIGIQKEPKSPEQLSEDIVAKLGKDFARELFSHFKAK